MATGAVGVSHWANVIEPPWTAVAELSGTGTMSTPAIAGPQHVSSAQILGAAATGLALPQSIPIGIAGAAIAAIAMPFAWLQQSILRWLPQALWLQSFSVNAG